MQTLQASWLRGRIERREIERWKTLLMRNEMGVKSLGRRVVKYALYRAKGVSRGLGAREEIESL